MLNMKKFVARGGGNTGNKQLQPAMEHHVTRQVERKCCPSYLALMNNLTEEKFNITAFSVCKLHRGKLKILRTELREETLHAFSWP